MTGSLDIIWRSLNEVWVQMLVFVPKILIALVIWVIGKYVLHFVVGVIRKVDLKGTKIDESVVGAFSNVVLMVGKALLILVILDFLGIGRTIIGAIANGLTFTIAIALGLAFGKALEEDAKEVVSLVKRQISKKS